LISKRLIVQEEIVQVPEHNSRTQWNNLATVYGEASMIDARDRRGNKNRYVETLVNFAIRECLRDCKDLSILDFGCGTGKRSRWFNRQGHQTTGIEISMELLRIGLSVHDVHRLPCVLFDGKNLPLASSAFDLVTSVGVLMYITDPPALKAVLRELFRVIKPGGSILLIEHTKRKHSLSRKDHKVFRTISEIDRELLEAGFRKTSVYPVRKGRYLPVWFGIRYGLIQARYTIPVAEHELAVRKGRSLSRWDYYDVLYYYSKMPAEKVSTSSEHDSMHQGENA
jgi:SAM-dependent methyltransferase